MWVGGKMQGIPHAYMAHGTPGPLGAFPCLIVDINGRRFTNEDIPGQTFSNIPRSSRRRSTGRSPTPSTPTRSSGANPATARP